MEYMAAGTEKDKVEEAFRVLGEMASPAPQKPLRTEPPPTPETPAEEARGLPYAEWKAQQLNELFRQHGVMGQPGRISAATVADGILKSLVQP
jgi:hypothetical protein